MQIMIKLVWPGSPGKKCNREVQRRFTFNGSESKITVLSDVDIDRELEALDEPGRPAAVIGPVTMFPATSSKSPDPKRHEKNLLDFVLMTPEEKYVRLLLPRW